VADRHVTGNQLFLRASRSVKAPTGGEQRWPSAQIDRLRKINGERGMESDSDP